jgi:hypothetical protein
MRHPNSRLALAFEAPRFSVISAVPCEPIASRPSHAGTWWGGFAPIAAPRRAAIPILGRDHRQRIVNAWFSVPGRHPGSNGGIADVDERSDTGAAAKKSAQGVGRSGRAASLPRRARCGAVEEAVAQHDRFKVVRARHHGFKLLDRGERLSGRASARLAQSDLLPHFDRPTFAGEGGLCGSVKDQGCRPPRGPSQNFQ